MMATTIPNSDAALVLQALRKTPNMTAERVAQLLGDPSAAGLNRVHYTLRHLAALKLVQAAQDPTNHRSTLNRWSATVEGATHE